MVVGVRPRVELSGFWRFKLDPGDVGESSGWFRGFDGDLIYVPASWNEQNPDWDGYGGVAWYQYDFHIPREFSGLTAWLVFEGAGYLTRVWFNGLSIGGHEGSFTQFRLRVNGVRFGDWNRVVVKVDNNSKSRPLGRGYPTTWGFSDTFINPDFTRVLVLGVVPPEGGFPYVR